MVRSNLSSEKVTLGAKKIQPTQERSYALPSPLGTSAHDAQYSPAWRVKYLIGELKLINYLNINLNAKVFNFLRIC